MTIALLCFISKSNLPLAVVAGISSFLSFNKLSWAEEETEEPTQSSANMEERPIYQHPSKRNALLPSLFPSAFCIILLLKENESSPPLIDCCKPWKLRLSSEELVTGLVIIYVFIAPIRPL